MPVEVGHAVLAQDHALAVEHEGDGAQPLGGQNLDRWANSPGLQSPKSSYAKPQVPRSRTRFGTKP
jgi:hypothetical protein